VSFGPDIVRGVPTSRTLPGEIDYRLARNMVVSEFKKGRLSRLDVCDAHPELLRAARNVGEPATQECPICDQPTLVNVSYVFGSRRPPQGRCVTSRTELGKLARRATELACYVVEVCPECAWNHLARSFPLGGSRRAAKA
jgi:hypothetical protein